MLRDEVVVQLQESAQGAITVSGTKLLTDLRRDRSRIIAPSGCGIQSMARSGEQSVDRAESGVPASFRARHAALVDTRQLRQSLLGKPMTLPGGAHKNRGLCHFDHPFLEYGF